MPDPALRAVPALAELIGLDEVARLEFVENQNDERVISALWAEAQADHPALADLLRARLRSLARVAPAEVAGAPVLSATSRMLEVELTEEEVNRYAQSALLLYRKGDEDEEEEKERNKREKALIAATRAEAKIARRKSLDRKESRSTPCEVRFLGASSEVVVVRLDTGAEVERRKATPAEISAYEQGRQQGLPF